jgi:ribose transport system permease protein
MGHFAGIPAQVALMIVIAALAYALIRFTVIGRQIIAVGGNEKAARLTGIPVKRVKTLVYVISGALAGIAGLIVVARNSASDANLVGMGMELDAIAAVAVGGSLLTGGRANIFGTLLGAFVIQLVRYTLLANGVPDAAALIVKAGLIVIAVFIQQRADKT